MSTTPKRLLLALLALLAVSASPLRASSTNPPTSGFFGPEYVLGVDDDGNTVYYLSYFDTYTFDPSDESYFYKYNFGWLYDFGGTTSNSDDIYFYDFVEDDVMYTSPDLYPYIYSFNLDSYLYYFEGSDPREFYNFDTDQYISY